MAEKTASAQRVVAREVPAEDVRVRAMGRRLAALYWEWVDQGRPTRQAAKEVAAC